MIGVDPGLGKFDFAGGVFHQIAGIIIKFQLHFPYSGWVIGKVQCPGNFEYTIGVRVIQGGRGKNIADVIFI